MIFFKLIFSAAVLFNTNVRVAYAGGNVPNCDSCYSLSKGGANCQNYSNQNPFVTSAGFRMVVINEIMADPSPPNQLPEVEFVEIMNTTDQTIDLTGWTFSDPRSTAVLPELTIGPDQLIILCKSGHEDLFSGFGVVAGLEKWPTLNNSGDALELQSADSVIIDQVRYTRSWYQDSDKSAGGWSLEQINPLDPCPDRENWLASQNPAGGTPGRPNSVLEINPDLRGPEIISALVKNDRQIEIWFNEKINTETIGTGKINIAPANEIVNIDFAQLFAFSIKISLSNPLEPNTPYSITIRNVTDCAGNLIQNEKNSIQFVLTVAGAPMDLVINEVLFNPRSGGKDFVEVFNTSKKYINLKGWQISNQKSTAEKPKVAIVGDDLIAEPGRYLVFTDDIAILKADYPFGKAENYFEVKSMPTLPDEAGNVTLTDSLGEVIDSFDYSEGYHLGLLRDLNGVSLERISATAPSNSRDNWHSAASAVGYATPGYENSQRLTKAPVAGQITIEPGVFVPNNDGIKDFTAINYQFDKGGYLISIVIYDVRGRRIKEIVNNELSGVSGFYQWNGTDERNLLVNPGYYIVLVNILDPEGRSFQIKKTVVVAIDF